MVWSRYAQIPGRAQKSPNLSAVKGQYREETVSQRTVRRQRLLHVSSRRDDHDGDEQVNVWQDWTPDDPETHGPGSILS